MKTPESHPSDKSEDEVHFVRHGKAQYKTYTEILASDDPQQPFNPENQVYPDLTEQGAEAVEIEAEKFITTLDPEKDALFFVSSNEARALQTANIYRKQGHLKGIEVIKPDKAGNKLAEEVGEGEIRTVKNLSIDSKNVLLDNLFNSSKHGSKVNWEAVDPATREKWLKAKEIVDADDKGSFGANFFAHSEAIQKIFPEVKTSRDLYEKNFQRLLVLVRFAIEKIKASGIDKRVHVMAFGHENYMMEALAQHFQEEGIANSEMITVEIEEGIITGKFRGKEAKL